MQTRWLAGLLLIVAGCGRSSPPPAMVPTGEAPAPAATSPQTNVEPEGAPFDVATVASEPYGELFEELAEWRLGGRRHQVTAGDESGSLHYKVLVRCEVAERVTGARGVAARIECANFPEDSIAPNPLEGVWVAGRGGLYRADEIPRHEGDWSKVFDSEPVMVRPPARAEHGGGADCAAMVADTSDDWCATERCVGEPTTETSLCFAKSGGLTRVEANTIADTTDLLKLEPLR